MGKKKIIIPIICLVVLFGVLGAVSQIDSKKDGAPKEDSGSIIDNSGIALQAERDSISEISVKLGDDSFSFVKVENLWTSPDKKGANILQSSVNSLANSVCSLAYDDVISISDNSESEYGIDENSDSISFLCSLGQVVIKRGNPVSDNVHTYISASVDNKIYIVNTETVMLIFRSFASYRSDSIVRVDFDNITAIDIKNESGKISLKKGKANTRDGIYYSWKMTSPIKSLAKDDIISESIISQAKELTISEYISDKGDYEKYSLLSNEKYITFSDVNGKSQTIHFSPENDSKFYIYLDSEPSIYSVSSGSAHFIDITPFELCDRNLNLAKRSRLTGVKISGNKTEINISLQPESMTVNGKIITDTDKTRKIFESICGLLADDIAPSGTNNAEITVKYEYTDSTSDLLEFSPYNDRYYISFKNKKPMFLIQKTKVMDMIDLVEKIAK